MMFRMRVMELKLELHRKIQMLEQETTQIIARRMMVDVA